MYVADPTDGATNQVLYGICVTFRNKVEGVRFKMYPVKRQRP